MSNDQQIPRLSLAAAPLEGKGVPAPSHDEEVALIPANSNMPEEEAKEVAEVYFALG